MAIRLDWEQMLKDAGLEGEDASIIVVETWARLFKIILAEIITFNQVSIDPSDKVFCQVGNWMLLPDHCYWRAYSLPQKGFHRKLAKQINEAWGKVIRINGLSCSTTDIPDMVELYHIDYSKPEALKFFAEIAAKNI